jgi:hypothetical protein
MAQVAVLGSRAMGYYLRAFCTTEDLPPLGRVLAWAATQGVSFALESSSPGALDSPGWREAELRYRPGDRPLDVDVGRAGDGIIFSEEVDELVDLLGGVEDSAATRKVLAHLGACRTIVAARLPSDIDDDGYDAAGVFLGFFVEHCGGMVQADAEGFYEGDRLIVELA